MTNSIPPPRYTIWQSIAVAIGLSTRALEEVRKHAARPGRLPSVIEWKDGVHYEGAVVAHLGECWQARRDTGRAPPHDDWVLVAAAGRDGASFNIRGTWTEKESYRLLDIVALGGASFAARVDNPGACPGPDWQMIARQGKPGERGERGETGRIGPSGRGLAAASVNDEGLLTLTHDDGSTVTCDFYPVLARLAR